MDRAWTVELDTQLPLDGRAELGGRLAPAEGEGGADRPAAVVIAPAGGERPLLTVPVGDAGDFRIPLGRLAPGYHELRVAGDHGQPAACFAVPGLRGEGGGAACGAGRYLDFVLETVALLWRKQSCRFGGSADMPLALTTPGPLSRSNLSLGHCEDGVYKTYWFPERPVCLEPVLLDFALWPLLEKLTDLTGDPQHAARVDEMAGVFAQYGFHPDSGLGYLGEEAGFDALRLRGAPTKVGNSEPVFKPRNSGHCPTLPLETLWRHAPRQMHRMFRSMYHGLITDPASMDFNRFCSYEYRDADERHVMERNPGHCAFDTAAGRMIHWWCSAYRHTGDLDCLDYAGRMLHKWEAVQHPDSGLVPNFFGAVAWAPGEPMPPGQWAELRAVALMATSLLEAAAELRQASGPGDLAGRMETMARRLAEGAARYGYDAAERLYVEILHLDGRVYEATARYAFRTQEEKDEAVRADPALQRVRVYRGTGLYRHQSHWEFCVGTRIPLHLTHVAEMTGSRELLDFITPVAADALAEARMTPEAFAGEGGWTFRASGVYVLMFLSLYRQTGDRAYLDGARELADAELERLARVVAPDWWRMDERVAWIDALLELHAATSCAPA